MRNTTSTPTDSEHVEALIPWYVNGTLGADDTNRVQRHLPHCPQCRASVELERKVASLLLEHRDTLDCAPQSGWNKLAAQLDSHKPPTREAAAAPQARSEIRRYLVPVVLTLQAAAIAGLSIALMQLIQTRNDASYHTLSDAPPSPVIAGPALRVVFDGATSSDQLRALLEPIDGTIRSGPSANGVYTIEIGESDVASSLKWLRSQPQVLFAEPIGAAGRD